MQRFGLNPVWDDIWVVFSPFTDLFYLKFLHKDFRHCFLIMEVNNILFVIDPLASRIEVNTLFINKIELFEIFKSKGMKIIKTSFFNINKKSWKFGIFTCVEVVKRVLGIYNWKIITPYQLYNFLNK